MTNLAIVEYQGNRVLTTAQLAEVYETEPKNIHDNFANNKERFVVDRDYVILEGDELRGFKRDYDNIGFASNLNKLYLWTSRGANRHSKILDTDKAWAQFDVLEETYYNASKAPRLPQTYLEALKELVVITEALTLAAHKAKYYDKLVDHCHLTNFRDTAKLIGVGQKKFMTFLEEHRYIYRDSKKAPKPYIGYVGKLFAMKDFSGRTKAGTQVFVTVEGKQRFSEEIKG